MRAVATFGSAILPVSRQLLASVLAFAIPLVAIGCEPLANQTPEASVPLATPEPERTVVTGLLIVLYGDPPPGSNLPARIDYQVTDKQGQQWSLMFDRNVYWPPDGPLAFNRKQVVVEGKLVGENKILVHSIHTG